MNSTKLSSSTSVGRRAPWLIGACLICAVVVVAAVASSRSSDDAATAAPPVRQLELVHAETFRVEQPFQHLWRAEQPLVDHGWLLVLAGDPAQMEPRQMQEPVLFVGAQTADRVNTGQGSGHVVVLVPGDFRLEDAPIFYGGKNLPEELRQLHIDAELADARRAGAVPPTAEAIARATAGNNGDPSYATDYQLRQRAIDLVEQYSPAETDLIAGWRLPLVK